MTEEMMGYIKDFVNDKTLKKKFRNIILYIGQKCENEGLDNVDGSLLMESQTILDLLVGSRVLEQPTGRTYKLTKRGEQLYELLKGEEFEKRTERETSKPRTVYDRPEREMQRKLRPKPEDMLTPIG